MTHSPLPQATFDCEVLTPLFLAGTQNTAELRGASIRGALRYWYRALLGGRGVSDINTLHAREAAVFGSTDRASPVRLRLLPYEGTSPAPTSQLDAFNSSRGDRNGTAYLWHFADASDRQYLPPETRFELQLLGRPGATEALADAIRAFWLLIHLGGLGTRSRRMAGAVAVSHANLPSSLDGLSFDADRPYDDWFTEQLARLGIGDAPIGPDRPAFSLLHPRHADVWRLQVRNADWSRLVNTIGTKFKNHREDLDIPDKIGLGLPIVTPKDTPDIAVTKGGTPVERRASPLWLQAVPGPDGNEVGAVATVMRSRFVDGSGPLRVSWDGGDTPVNDPYAKLGTFVRDSDLAPTPLLPDREHARS